MNGYTLHYGDQHSLILLLSIILTILLQCLVVQSMYILPHFYLQWTCSIIDLILCLIVWLLLLSSPFVSQVFTAFLGITHFCAVGMMWPCTLTQKMANGFLEVFQYSLSGHSSSTLFDCSSFGHYRNNTMQFLTICCSWNSRNGCLYVHEASAHVPVSTCGTGSWVLWCMYEIDVVFNQHDTNFFLHITPKRLY